MGQELGDRRARAEGQGCRVPVRPLRGGAAASEVAASGSVSVRQDLPHCGYGGGVASPEHTASFTGSTGLTWDPGGDTEVLVAGMQVTLLGSSGDNRDRTDSIGAGITPNT